MVKEVTCAIKIKMINMNMVQLKQLQIILRIALRRILN